MSVERLQTSPGSTGDTKWFMKRQQQELPFNPLSWISTPLQPEEVPASCSGVGCLTPDQRAQGQNLVRRVIGISLSDAAVNTETAPGKAARWPSRTQTFSSVG